MKKLVFLAFLITIISSCHRATEIGSIINKTDSTTSKIVIRDSIITIPGQNDTLWLKNPCDSLGHLKPIIAIKRKGKVSTQAITKGGQNLEIISSCDEYKIKLDSARITIETLEKSTNSSTKTIQIKYIPKLYKYSFIFSIFVVLFIIFRILVALKIIKI